MPIPDRDGLYLWHSKECPEPSVIELFSRQRYVGFPQMVSIESSKAFVHGTFKYVGEIPWLATPATTEDK